MQMTFLVGFSATNAALCIWAAQLYIHMAQLEGYKARPTFFWIMKNRQTTLLLPVLIGMLSLVISVFFPVVGAVVYAFAVGYLTWRRSKRPQKKPLTYTARVKRLVAIVGFWSLALAAGSMCVSLYSGQDGWGFALYLLTPFVVCLSLLCAWPMEESIKKGYFRDAQRRLAAREDLIKIGITGSFGKTSTKFILGTLLREKYNVLVPPSSFNTPMGLTRVVREQLKDEHEVFLAEMGAKHKGDIKELCDLVHPTIGVITSVGPQHLETFGSLEVIKSTKYELIDALPQDGVSFFPSDGGICEEFFHKTHKGKKHLCGLSGVDLFVTAKDATVGPFGSRFLLCIEGKQMQAEVPLLGKHNIENILLCCAVAWHLGLREEELLRGLKKLQPVEHRLQILPSGNGLTVIDDAFNSNPTGAHAALDVLASFPNKRIIITPGMVELGKDEDAHNLAFGKKMASCVDVAILVGLNRVKPIVQGLEEGGFSKENLHLVRTLEEASKLLPTLAGAGDVVLFENDLPDNYAEN